MPDFAYTYVLLCADGHMYIGSTPDLRQRFQQHECGYVPSTRSRCPVKLVYYEACLSLEKAREREQQLKTGYGRKFLKTRIVFPDHVNT